MLYLSDLMQGESPADAFTSLPASMRGADEGADDVLTLDPLVPVAPVKGAPKERLWSLDKEQVSVKVLCGTCVTRAYRNLRDVVKIKAVRNPLEVLYM